MKDFILIVLLLAAAGDAALERKTLDETQAALAASNQKVVELQAQVDTFTAQKKNGVGGMPSTYKSPLDR